jgi:hypothetical protein
VRKGRDKDVRIVVLSREQARDLWQAELLGQRRLLLSPADLSFDGDRVQVSSRDAHLELSVFPPLQRRVRGFERKGRDGIFERRTAYAPVPALPLEVQKIQDADVPPPVQLGSQGVATPPPEAALARSALWSLRVPARAARQLSKDPLPRHLLRIGYRGDIARLYAGERLITDDFYKGTPWEIGLWRATAEELARGLELRILPLRQDAPIHLPDGAWPAFSERGDAVALETIEVLTDHVAVMDLSR